MKQYFIMTTEEKALLEGVCKALDIPFEDMLEIPNIKDLREHNQYLEARVQTLEEKLLETIQAFNKLSANVTEINARLVNLGAYDVSNDYKTNHAE